MLQLSGKCLGVKSEQMNGPTGAFEAVTLHVLDGVEVTACRVGRDYPSTDLPREGEDVVLHVVVSAFARRSGGAGVQMTALSRIKSGARVAPVAASA